MDADYRWPRFHYAKIKQFPGGNRGKVWLVKGDNIVPEAEATAKPRRYVLKEILLRDEDDVQQLEAKWELLRSIRHDNVIRYLHVEILPETLTKPAHLVVLMEWCRLDSLANLFSRSRPEWSTLHRLIKDIVAGVAHIHSQHIFHGDLKPDNIFIDVNADGELLAKIGDLDDFVQVPEGTTNKTALNATQLVGTLRYLSPERLRNDTDNVHVKRNADIWSLGCTFLDLVTYQSVYFVKPNQERLEVKKYRKDESAVNAVKEVAQLNDFLRTGGRPYVSRSLQPLLRSFIQRCLIEDPAKRPSAKDLQNDPWIHSDPGIRYLDGVSYEPHVIRLKNNSLLPRQVEGESDFENISWNLPWSNSANCAVRFLAHFEAPFFKSDDAEQLIKESPKALTPGKPLEQKYRDLLLEILDAGTVRVTDPMIKAMAPFFINNDEFMTKFTKGLQPVGAPFPDLVGWMNTFEKDYEYVVKENAGWTDIQSQLDNGQPVMVMLHTHLLPLRLPINGIFGNFTGLPEKIPSLGIDIVHGYVGDTDENRALICTSASGVVREQSYSHFMGCWQSWKIDDWIMQRVFECAQVRPRTMVYRQKNRL
ncbi:uncharacterized protein LOC129595751 [Paramacrobiotus metropolitanus]|uniref:uncharacterized protein LOC129595751 n=1 Tax=Paramacrobiotus metropolitanus TaxID=2943436 RepID=UPI002445B948|nr:uncharacterized protein LOC129595751 [Paramacrobiotus metropolitanus]